MRVGEGYAQYRLHAHKRIRRRDDDGLGLLQARYDLRCCLRRLCAVEEDALDHRLPLPPHKVFLKFQHALIGFDQRPKAIVRHRQDRRLDAERARDRLRCFGQRLALPQQRRAIHMRRQIAIANVEPRLQRPGAAARRALRTYRRPRPSLSAVFATPPSVYVTVSRSGQTCQTVPFKIIARVDDDGQSVTSPFKGEGLGVHAARDPCANFAPPTPPANVTMFMMSLVRAIATCCRQRRRISRCSAIFAPTGKWLFLENSRALGACPHPPGSRS